MGTQNFQKSIRHLKILGATTVTWSKVYNENPQILGAIQDFCTPNAILFILLIAKTALNLLKEFLTTLCKLHKLLSTGKPKIILYIMKWK